MRPAVLSMMMGKHGQRIAKEKQTGYRKMQKAVRIEERITSPTIVKIGLSWIYMVGCM